MTAALVYGIAVAGDALASELARRGWRLVVADDRPTDEKRATAARLGAEFVASPDAAGIAALVQSVDMVCPAPGVPETHPLIDAAVVAGRPIRTEIDLAYEWEQERPGGPRGVALEEGRERQAAEAGADCLSVLTETTYFQGRLADLVAVTADQALRPRPLPRPARSVPCICRPRRACLVGGSVHHRLRDPGPRVVTGGQRGRRRVVLPRLNWPRNGDDGT